MTIRPLGDKMYWERLANKLRPHLPASDVFVLALGKWGWSENLTRNVLAYVDAECSDGVWLLRSRKGNRQ